MSCLSCFWKSKHRKYSCEQTRGDENAVKNVAEKPSEREPDVRAETRAETKAPPDDEEEKIQVVVVANEQHSVPPDSNPNGCVAPAVASMADANEIGEKIKRLKLQSEALGDESADSDVRDFSCSVLDVTRQLSQADLDRDATMAGDLTQIVSKLESLVGRLEKVAVRAEGAKGDVDEGKRVVSVVSSDIFLLK